MLITLSQIPSNHVIKANNIVLKLLVKIIANFLKYIFEPAIHLSAVDIENWIFRYASDPHLHDR